MKWRTEPRRNTALDLATGSAPTSRLWAGLGVIAVIVLIGVCW